MDCFEALILSFGVCFLCNLDRKKDTFLMILSLVWSRFSRLGL